jgi:hypothetical protein
MLGRLCIRGWVFVVALNVALVLAIGFSFVRPIGIAYRSTFTYPEQRFSDGTSYGELSVAYFDGVAFHEGGLVFFRFMEYHDSYKISGVRIVRIDHDNMRAEIYCAMHPTPDGYAAERLGAKVGVDYPIEGSRKILVVPLWVVLLVVGAPLGRRCLGVFVKFRRKREGCCATCGYDMRASGNRCPECGAVSMSA